MARTIREYAKEVGHEIIGKLTRRPEWEYTQDSITGDKRHDGSRCYIDEGGNEYYIYKKGFTIVNIDGEVI